MYNYTVEPLYIQSGENLIACDYYRPENIKKPALIIMAHGFAALRQFHLIPFAQRFAQAGYAVLLFDYRYWGGSTGKPRELVSIQAQLDDWYQVLTHAFNRKDINTQQIIVWGTGLSGGYVLKLAADVQKIAAVIAQVPFLDGSETAKLYPMHQYPKALKMSSQDYVGSKIGIKALKLPVVHPYALSFFPHSESYNGYMSIVDAHYFWSGEVAARALFELFRFRPIQFVQNIKKPMLLLCATKDRQTPIQTSRLVKEKMQQYAEYLEWDMHHFDIYHDQYLENAIVAQLSFLERIVGKNR